MTLEQARERHEDAVREALALKSRNVDPATMAGALEKVSMTKRLLAQLQSDANMQVEIDRITAGASHGNGGGRGGRGLGAQILDSETGKWLLKHRGQFPSGTWQSPSSELMAATLTEDPASGGALVITDHQAGIVPIPTRRLTVAGLLAPGTTESNTVGFMRETAATVNAADTVAEGAAKPESTIVFEGATAPVRKIATWLPVSEEILEDVPALRAYLDVRLRLFVDLKEDDQLLNGNGVAPNILGLMNLPGITAAHPRGADSNAEAIMKQTGIIETATSMEVDGYVIHPTNWESILLLKAADGTYIAGGGPLSAPGPKTLWGRPVAVTPAIALGTALVGAFKTAAQYFRRGGMRVEASNSHSDFFVKNLVAIRAEKRGALAAYREAAFGQVTGLN
jgi:HK97 family phage major capsid protein